MGILITIPTKTAPEYLDRAASCEATWLKNCPVDYKFFRDSDFRLEDTDLMVRQKRMKAMCRYALDAGYDYLFRVDADAYVWVDRLLASGFDQHDYMGYCLDYPPDKARNRTAHGGAGFSLSRRAMLVVAEGPHFPHGSTYWGDIWTGQLLYDHGIHCQRDTRFETDLPAEANIAELSRELISVHPVDIDTQRSIWELGCLNSSTYKESS